MIESHVSNKIFELRKLIQTIIANEAADPRGSAVELANHRAVREYTRKLSSQRKGPFFDHIWVYVIPHIWV